MTLVTQKSTRRPLISWARQNELNTATEQLRVIFVDGLNKNQFGMAQFLLKRGCRGYRPALFS